MKDHLITLQQQQINGPFKRVRYIPPYPDRLLKFPKTRLGGFLKLFALVFMLLCPVIFIGAEVEVTEKMIPNAFLVNLAQEIRFAVTEIAIFLEIERILATILLSAISFCICLMLVVLANTLAKHSVIADWKTVSRRTTAKILDKELQKITIRNTDPSHNVGNRPKVWVYRLRVAFTHNGRTYEATPSCINRLSPGTLPKHFKNEEEARQELDSYQDHVNIEFDPSNPLDCELEGQMEWQSRTFNRQFIYLFGWLIAAVVFAYAFIVIFKK